MPTMLIHKDGFYDCNGTGMCGGTNADDATASCFKQVFNCDSCHAYLRDNQRLKVIDERKSVPLSLWFDKNDEAKEPHPQSAPLTVLPAGKERINI